MDKFFQILYVPFGFLFRILFDFVGNYGFALIIFTLFFRVILLPSAVKQQKGMAKQYRLQPKLKRIREKYQDFPPNERNQKIKAPKPKANLLSSGVEKAALRQTASSSPHSHCPAPFPGVQLEGYTHPHHIPSSSLSP